MKKNNIKANPKKSNFEGDPSLEVPIPSISTDKKTRNRFLNNKIKRCEQPEEKEFHEIDKFIDAEKIDSKNDKLQKDTNTLYNSTNNFNDVPSHNSIRNKFFSLIDDYNLDKDKEDNLILEKLHNKKLHPNIENRFKRDPSFDKDFFKTHSNFNLIKEMDDLKNISHNSKSFYSRQKISGSSEFIKRALEGLKIEDEMVVLSNLCELSSELSMANDTVGDDSNIHYLIKELILLFDKYYMLPDIIMSALTCLNYILDLNVRLTSSIVKHGGIKKIVNMTQNIDYIDCAENAIKAIEKMSFENPYLIIEMDAFQAVLSLIDFFDLNLRKSALKACVNMSKAFNGVEQIKKFVFPALPSLANLTKYSGNSEIEKNILDLAVQCYYNIIYYVKMYNMAGANENFCNSLTQYGFLSNMFELFVNFLRVDLEAESKPSDDKPDIQHNNSYTMNIQVETFKNIIRIFDMVCCLSAEITNTILDYNILEIMFKILSKELSVDSTKKKLSSGSASCYIEIFNLLISFFPNKKSKQPDRLLSENNKHYYIYFSEKILSFLLFNIVNISSSNTMVSVVKLVEMYIKNSNAEYVEKYIDPTKLSNIAGKMLDSRDSSYILEVFNLVEIIMNKVPEKFFISFLREGVVDNIKTLTEIEENKLYIPNDPSKLLSNSKYLYSDFTQSDKHVQFSYGGNDESYGEDFVEEDEIVEDWDLNSKEGSENPGNYGMSGSEIKNISNKEKLLETVMVDHRQKEFLDFINKKMEKKNLANTANQTNVNNTINITNNKKSVKDENVDNKIIYNPFMNKNKISANPNQSESNKVVQTQSLNNTNNLQSFVDLSVVKNQESSQEFLSSSSNSNLVNPLVEEKMIKKTVPVNQPYSSNAIATMINLKAKEIIEKFFKEEDFDAFMKKSQSTINPKDILQKLNNIKEILKTPNKVDSSVLSFLFQIILGKDKLTFYELEKSEVILCITKFLDENFFQNYGDTTETDYKTTSNISGFYNKNIIKNLKMLLDAMNNDLNKINEFIKILQYCISSMNCFKLYLYDTGNTKYASLMLSQMKTPKLRMKFAYSPNEISMIQDENKLFKDILEYFKSNRNVTLVFEQSENFINVSEALIKFAREIKDNNPSKSQSIKDDYFEEIFTHFRNRKGSEEDMQFTEKILQRLIERKKSTNSNDNEELAELNEEGLSIKNMQSSSKTNLTEEEEKNKLLSNLETNFYVIINNIRMDIKNEWSIIDFVRELKSVYKKSEYTAFVTDIQINFTLTLKVNRIINDPNSIKNVSLYSKDDKITLERESTTNYIYGNYENNLFDRFYRDNIINNPALYCIKRASPFFYLIAVLEMGINNFKNIFEMNQENSNLAVLSNLENLKVTTLLFKQAKDPYCISSGNLPKWCKELSGSFTYLAGFNSRYLLFKVSSFDSKRSISNLYIYLKNFMGETIFEDKTLSHNKRHKFKVDRNNIIKDTEKLMKEFQGYKGYLEFEYYDEVGTGLGPTLEFYSLFAKEIKSIINLWYKTDDYSLFPCPIDSNNHSKTEDNIKLFNLLGFVVARGLYDDRLIDFPLNSLFWDLVLDRPISYDKLKKIDKNLGKTINDFQSVIAHKQRITNNPKFLEHNCDLNDFVRYNNVKIEDLSLVFTLPGYPEIELKRGGENTFVTVHNIEEYVSLIFDKLILNGSKPFVDAFKTGFNKVFPISNLKTFTSSELEDIICGCSQDKWEYEDLVENIIPAHGYHKNSLIYKGLIDIMLNMNSIEKKNFLLFSTGSPRLPLGGFKNLTPKLTVVVKKNQTDDLNSDEYLPTVMTCQNFLKIPEYSSLDILKEKLQHAMEEGSNAFHLS